jgi:hypothetical protein
VKLADGKMKFGPWIPDLPDLDNPGITEAKNVLPVDGVYKPFRPLISDGSDALAARPYGAIEVFGSSANKYLYAGTQTKLYRQDLVLGTYTDVSNGGGSYSASTEAWEFAVYDTLIIATNYYNTPEKATIGSGSFGTLASTGTPPKARRIGKVGQFIILGDLNDGTVIPHRIQWCGIDDPTNWSTPGTSAAVTVQAGEQYLDSEWGNVNAIRGGDQFGIVLQTGGLTRMTYVGGQTVWQFDKVAGAQGTQLPHSVVGQNGLWYYISQSGVSVTDGTRAELIGVNQVDQYFNVAYSDVDRERVHAALYPSKKLIFFSYSTVLGARPSSLLIYNTEEKRYTHADQDCELLISPAAGELTPGVSDSPRAFDSSNVYGTFAGTIGTATLTSPEVEFSPGGRTLVQGIKPLIQRAGGSVNATVAIGTRDKQDAAVSYTSEATPSTRHGFAEFRSDARYHRARTTITGNFDSITGLEFQQVPSGAV